MRDQRRTLQGKSSELASLLWCTHLPSPDLTLGAAQVIAKRPPINDSYLGLASGLRDLLRAFVNFVFAVHRCPSTHQN